jgi:hypothetical protein
MTRLGMRLSFANSALPLQGVSMKSNEQHALWDERYGPNHHTSWVAMSPSSPLTWIKLTAAPTEPAITAPP